MEFREPLFDDKEIIEEYIKEHENNNEHILHGSNMLDKLEFEKWIKRIKETKTIPDGEWGISDTLIAVNENNKMVGIVNIRYNLSEELALKYGNIGYGVCPSERRKGIASLMLKKALEKCKEKGLKKVILGCRKDNIGSAKTILKNGGILEREEMEEGIINQYYLITV